MKNKLDTESFKEELLEELKKLPYFGPYWNLSSQVFQQGYSPTCIPINYEVKKVKLKNEKQE